MASLWFRSVALGFALASLGFIDFCLFRSASLCLSGSFKFVYVHSVSFAVRLVSLVVRSTLFGFVWLRFGFVWLRSVPLEFGSVSFVFARLCSLVVVRFL